MYRVVYWCYNSKCVEEIDELYEINRFEEDSIEGKLSYVCTIDENNIVVHSSDIYSYIEIGERYEMNE